MRGGSEVGSLFFRLKAVESSKSDEIVDGRPRSALPVGIKLFADKTGVVGPFLGLEGLFEAEERARVAGIPLEVRAEDILGSGVITDFQQYRAERFAHGIEPVLRLVVLQGMLNGVGSAKLVHRGGH